MKVAKRKKLEAAGWRVGNADEFLGIKRERKLSYTQIRMLKNVRDGLPHDAHCSGMSEYGGAEGTWRSLVRRGLLAWRKNDLVITAFGRATLKEIK